MTLNGYQVIKNRMSEFDVVVIAIQLSVNENSMIN